MRTCFVALAVSLVSIQAQAREISVDELSLMTLPELAKMAYSECSEQMERIRKSMEYIDQSTGHGLDHGLVMFQSANEAMAEANVHKQNLARLKLVVRKQLNGEEPAWAEAYTTAKTSDGCDTAKDQYEEWAKERENKKVPETKKGRGRKTAQ